MKNLEKTRSSKPGRSIMAGSAAGEKPSAFCLLPSAFSLGFTLIELLLVIVIIGVALGIAMPSFVRSIQGQRLKTAARTVATVARYARSMAVLKQTDLTLSFNLATGQIDLTSTNATLPRFTRTVEGVSVAYLQVEGKEPADEGTCLVSFKRNGLCRPFNVKITDPRGNYVIVKVDALAGVKATEYGNE
jgi:prepilin-type N-terminal cleavage/methylation domain-containing protein